MRGVEVDSSVLFHLFCFFCLVIFTFISCFVLFSLVLLSLFYVYILLAPLLGMCCKPSTPTISLLINLMSFVFLILPSPIWKITKQIEAQSIIMTGIAYALLYTITWFARDSYETVIHNPLNVYSILYNYPEVIDSQH